MIRHALESAGKELSRHLKLGKSVRSPNGANRVREFVRAALADSATRRLCSEHGLKTGDLCLACAELIDALPDDLLPQVTELFCNSVRTEEFLGELHRATESQTDLQRRMAIIACAKRRAAAMDADAPKEAGEVATRRRMLDASIASKLPIILLCAAVIVAGILMAVYLL